MALSATWKRSAAQIKSMPPFFPTPTTGLAKYSTHSTAWRIADNTLVIFSSDNGPARASKPGELKLQLRYRYRGRLGHQRRQRNHRRPQGLQGCPVRRRYQCSLHCPLAGKNRRRESRRHVTDLGRRSCCRPFAKSPEPIYLRATSRTASANVSITAQGESTLSGRNKAIILENVRLSDEAISLGIVRRCRSHLEAAQQLRRLSGRAVRHRCRPLRSE